MFSAINSATALRHALESAAAQRDRVLETLSKLQVESEDVRIEFDRLESDRASAADGLRRAHEALDGTRMARAARESELASARIEHEWRARSVRSREHELAGLVARLKSLEELEAGARRVRRRRADGARAGQRQGQPEGRGRRLPRGRRRAASAPSKRSSATCSSTSSSNARSTRLAGFELVREASAGTLRLRHR